MFGCHIVPIAKDAPWWKPESKSSLESPPPKKRWYDTLKKELQLLEIYNSRQLAENREE